MYRLWSPLCGAQSLFYFILQPAETFSFSMRPMYGIVFETPGLIYKLLSMVLCFLFRAAAVNLSDKAIFSISSCLYDLDK